MEYTYIVNGMTCSSCESKIRGLLLQIPIVKNVEINRAENKVTIDSKSQLSQETIQSLLGGNNSKYQVEKYDSPISSLQNEGVIENIWFQTYKPILLIFFYLLITSFGYQLTKGSIDFMEWMRHFMAGFFLVFSFFKFLNIKGFADSYAMYDIVASRVKIWAYIYPFLELIIGLFFLFDIQPLATNAFTLILMSVSIVGVISSVLNKKKIKCACLGDIFNLPMSTVTIIEDALMIVMSIIMIIQY
ncbi:MAG: hypothetical protein RLZZ546_1942 [Bacteroidota bacterium]|jgi:copper chaperone CopZ